MQRRFSLMSLKLVLTINQKVASFALQYETTAAILEDLFVLKSWNPLWEPKSSWLTTAKIKLFYLSSFCICVDDSVFYFARVATKLGKSGKIRET